MFINVYCCKGNHLKIDFSIAGLIYLSPVHVYSTHVFR